MGIGYIFGAETWLTQWYGCFGLKVVNIAIGSSDWERTHSNFNRTNMHTCIIRHKS